MDLKPTIDALQKFTRTLRAIQAPKKPLSDYQLAEGLRKAITDALEVDFQGLTNSLSSEEKTVADRINSTIEQRRENLLKSARALGVPHKRFGEYDRIGPLKITYMRKKIRLEIGSELVSEFDEADGEKIFEKAQQTLKTFEDEPFDRDKFFQAMKDAVRLAKDHGRADRDGWVPIRLVYTYFVLLRHLYMDDYIKKPETNKFRKYSKAQFLYDLARFGSKGWSVRNETLRSRTPNMATVAAGKTMVIPDLRSVEGFGDQVSVMRVEKQESE